MELLIHDKKLQSMKKCSGISFSDTLKKHGAKLGSRAWGQATIGNVEELGLIPMHCWQNNLHVAWHDPLSSAFSFSSFSQLQTSMSGIDIAQIISLHLQKDGEDCWRHSLLLTIKATSSHPRYPLSMRQAT
jgi:hypothetical protein